jgi:uncharacterized protein YjbJ (UPF0337 family)
MDWNHAERNWEQVKPKVKQKWGRLTEEDLRLINGRRELLESKIQQRYGFAIDHIRNDIENWLRWQASARYRRRTFYTSPLLARKLDGSSLEWLKRRLSNTV